MSRGYRTAGLNARRFRFDFSCFAPRKTARIEILHEGAFGRDRIAIRVNDATIALRRREAMAILVG